MDPSSCRLYPKEVSFFLPPTDKSPRLINHTGRQLTEKTNADETGNLGLTASFKRETKSYRSSEGCGSATSFPWSSVPPCVGIVVVQDTDQGFDRFDMTDRSKGGVADWNLVLKWNKPRCDPSEFDATPPELECAFCLTFLYQTIAVGRCGYPRNP